MVGSLIHRHLHGWFPKQEYDLIGWFLKHIPYTNLQFMTIVLLTKTVVNQTRVTIGRQIIRCSCCNQWFCRRFFLLCLPLHLRIWNVEKREQWDKLLGQGMGKMACENWSHLCVYWMILRTLKLYLVILTLHTSENTCIKILYNWAGKQHSQNSTFHRNFQKHSVKILRAIIDWVCLGIQK